MPMKGDRRYKSITINARAYRIFEEEADRRKLLRRNKYGELKPNVAMVLDKIALELFDKRIDEEEQMRL